MAATILVVDDNPDQITIVQRILQKADPSCRVVPAADAEAALQQLAEEAYDLVLCDYRLPGANGLEFLKQVQAQQRGLPVIIVTSAGNERVAVEAMHAGAYDYLIKDAAYDAALPGVIQRTLERHRMQQERARLERERNDALQALQQEKQALAQMNHLMMNREDRILELKREVNALLHELGRPPKYGT